MHLLHKIGQSALSCLLIVAVVVFSWGPTVYAGAITPVSATLSVNSSNSPGVTYTLGGTTSTTDDVKQIEIQFSTVQNGSTIPQGLDLTSTVLTSTQNLGSDWTIELNASASGMVRLINTAAQPIAASTTFEIVLDDITNSSIDACQPENNGLIDTCWIKISTYSDEGTTLIDSGSTTYTVSEIPYLSFEVSGVSSGATHNGITSTATSTQTSLPFGKLDPGEVKYLTQKLFIQTNAPGGYTVTAALPQNIMGSYNNAEIDPFAGVDATWSTPQTWESPVGTEASENTGWFGANTNDGRIPGWAHSEGKFAPLGTSARAVAYSETPDRTGTEVYVSYALEINGVQPADLYTGTVIYNVQANY